MSETAALLRELHRIHRQLSDLNERLDRGPKQLKARETNVTRLEAELTRLQADTTAAQIASDQKQLLLRSGEAKIQDLRRKLNECSSNREYQALLEQIAADEMANSVLADEILEALEKIDDYKRQIGQARQNVQTSKQELAKTRETVGEQQQRLEADVARLTADLKQAEVRLPAEFLDAYRRVAKAKGSEALAPIEGNICGGCFHQLPPNLHNDVSMGRAAFCHSCGRLLYAPEDRRPGAAGAES